MRSNPILLAIAAGVLVATAACGPDAPSTPDTSTTTPAAPAATTTSAAARASGVTPDQLCGLVTTAQMSQFTGFTMSSTKTEMSGNTAVCHYLGTAADSTTPVSKVIIEFQPDGKGAVEFTKSKGEAVSGIGAFAVYFSTSAQLSVELDNGDAVFHVFVEDVRANHNDPKGAAVQIAQTAVPRLPH